MTTSISLDDIVIDPGERVLVTSEDHALIDRAVGELLNRTLKAREYHNAQMDLPTRTVIADKRLQVELVEVYPLTITRQLRIRHFNGWDGEHSYIYVRHVDRHMDEPLLKTYLAMRDTVNGSLFHLMEDPGSMVHGDFIQKYLKSGPSVTHYRMSLSKTELRTINVTRNGNEHFSIDMSEPGLN